MRSTSEVTSGAHAVMGLPAKLQVIDYLKRNAQRILAEGPTKEQVCREIQQELKLPIGNFTLKSICQAIGFSWKAKGHMPNGRRVAGHRLAKAHGTLSYGAVCEAIRTLYKKFNMQLPGSNSGQEVNGGGAEPATTSAPHREHFDIPMRGFDERHQPNPGFVPPMAPRDPEAHDMEW